ncbi:MAG: hypothetical protein AB1521_08425 [Bacteroidota bacterium]
MADTEGIPLTIEFTPQWAEYIASDQFKLSLLKEWQKKGHEIGAHHHGIEVGAGWDGFTNHTQNEITFPDMYRGDMNDFISIINSIKGDSLITTAGIGDTVDLHPQFRFWTYGHTLDDAVSNPELFNILGNNYWRITYCFVGDTATVKALINKYRNTAGYCLFGMVTHVFNFDDDELYLKNLFEFFKDKNCKTVTQLMRERGLVSDVDYYNGKNLMNSFILYQNYPNPFNPSTTIEYSIPTPPISLPLIRGGTEGGVVTLKVYDILGREVETLVNEYQRPGKYSVSFDVETCRGASLPSGVSAKGGYASGVYFYRLQAGNFSSVRKMIYLK